MSDDLREKLRKIEALFAGAGTPGERAAAEAAAQRIRARLAEAVRSDPPVEVRLAVGDPWSRQLLLALLRRYGLKPYRYPRMQRQSVVVRVPRSFLDTLLWPEFNALNKALTEHLAEITQRVIRESVHGDMGEPEEVAEPPRLPGR